MIATKPQAAAANAANAVEAARASLEAASKLKFKSAPGGNTNGSSPANPTIDADTDAKDMSLTAYAIFSGATNHFTTSAGKSVLIRQATMKQVPIVLSFFQEIVRGLDQRSLIALVDLYADRQRKAMAAGKNPNEIEIGPEEEDTEAVVGKVFGNVSLLTQLLAAAAEVLPELVAAFTNLTEEEYEALDVDEGLTLVGGIFMLNYGFFSRSLPPIFGGLMRSLADRQDAESLPPKTNTKLRRRR